MLYVFGIALCALSLAINFLLLRFLKTLGTKDQKAKVELRWSSQAKPTIGGISFFVGLLVALLSGLALADIIYLGESRRILLLAGAIVAFLMGLADDAFNTKPLLKFWIQLACGIAVYLAGAGFVFPVAEWLNLVLTVFWVVALMNALNMLDNMDGITAGVATVMLGGLWYLLPESALSYLVFGMAATLLGFLHFNWSPSAIFMGDSGSQLLGFLIAALSLLIWNNGIDLPEVSVQRTVLSMVVFTFTPLCDTAFVSWNRLAHKRSPFVGGRDHTTHNLSYLGLSERLVGFFFVLWAMGNVATAIWLRTYEGALPLRWYVGIVAYMLFAFISFLLLSRKNLKNKKYTYTL